MPAITYFASKLSPHILERPTSGFLICVDVPICRSGFQEYLGRELKKHKDYDPSWNLEDDEIYKVNRPRAEVTSAKTIASFQDVPVADGHPDPELAPGSLITCENAKDFSCGHLSRVRVGDDLSNGDACLIADFHIQNDTLINKVCDQDIRDVSSGYIYRLRMIDGVLEMYDIEGNHEAVVPKGRAGSEVAIADSAPARIEAIKEKHTMTIRERIRAGAASWKSRFAQDPDGTAYEAAAMDAEIEEKGKTAMSTEDAKAKAEADCKAAKDAEEKKDAEAKAAKDAAEAEEKDSFREAAHDALDRVLDAHASPEKVGKDAHGCDSNIPDLVKQLNAFFGEEAKEQQHQGSDAELETLQDAESETEEAKKEREEKEAADKAAKDAEEAAKKEEAAASDVAVIDPDTKVDDTGKAAFGAVMDAAVEHVKALRPRVARIIGTPKAKRSAEDQAMVDSYNTKVKAINHGRAALKDPYAVFAAKVKSPEAVAATDSIPVLKSPLEFYNGKTAKEGAAAYQAYLDSIKEKK